MSDTVSSAPKPKWSKLLIASLALNLLVVGLVGGAFLKRHRWAPHGGLNVGKILGDPGLQGFISTLPRERSAILQIGADEARRSLKPLRQAARQARLNASAAMNAEPFDAVRAETVMYDWIAIEAEARKASVSLLLKTVSQMTSSERSLFQAWRKRHERISPEPVEGKSDKASLPNATSRESR
jgi:uncharacterized membrane protein